MKITTIRTPKLPKVKLPKLRQERVAVPKLPRINFGSKKVNLLKQ